MFTLYAALLRRVDALRRLRVALYVGVAAARTGRQAAAPAEVHLQPHRLQVDRRRHLARDNALFDAGSCYTCFVMNWQRINSCR